MSQEIFLGCWLRNSARRSPPIIQNHIKDTTGLFSPQSSDHITALFNGSYLYPEYRFSLWYSKLWLTWLQLHLLIHCLYWVSPEGLLCHGHWSSQKKQIPASRRCQVLPEGNTYAQRFAFTDISSCLQCPSWPDCDFSRILANHLPFGLSQYLPLSKSSPIEWIFNKNLLSACLFQSLPCPESCRKEQKNYNCTFL